MQQASTQILHFLQDGLASIFRFVQLIWSWSITEINGILSSPWQNWPLWKQVMLLLIIGAIAWALFKVATELWSAVEKTLAAFAQLLTALIRTLPAVLMAGAIALAGAWMINNFNPSAFHMPDSVRQFSQRPRT